jgi:hypothetical protein
MNRLLPEVMIAVWMPFATLTSKWPKSSTYNKLIYNIKNFSIRH